MTQYFVHSTQLLYLKSLCAIFFCFVLHFEFLSLIQMFKTWQETHSLAIPNFGTKIKRYVSEKLERKDVSQQQV